MLGDDKGGVMMDYPDPKSIHTGDPISDRMARHSIGEMSAEETAVYGGIYRQITTDALSRIVRHLSGVPGRKNLVWLQEEPQVPPGVMAMLAAANVSLYPVLIRSVDPSIGDIFLAQHAVKLLGASTRGAGFVDAGDLITAVRTAEEDSRSAYTLAFIRRRRRLTEGSTGSWCKLRINICRFATVRDISPSKRLYRLPCRPTKTNSSQLMPDPGLFNP